MKSVVIAPAIAAVVGMAVVWVVIANPFGSRSLAHTLHPDDATTSALGESVYMICVSRYGRVRRARQAAQS